MTVVRRLPNGQEVTQVDPGEAALIYREIFVEKSYLREGFPAPNTKVVFDIGANIGLASMFLKQTLPDALIVAAEPGPDTFRALSENFARHVPSGQAHNVAVTASSGTARFGFYPQAPAESGLYTDQARDTRLATELLVESGFEPDQASQFAESRHHIEYVECRTVTLSELIRESGVDRVDLLKVDVEKAELDVLAGIEEQDWAKLGQIVIEVHDLDGRLDTVTSTLGQRGFAVEVCQEDRLTATDMYMLFATRQG